MCSSYRPCGGEGLSIIAADVVVLYDSNWNLQIDAQAAARIHRLGQTMPVRLFRLILRGSIDEYILKLAALKNTLCRTVMNIGQTVDLDWFTTERLLKCQKY